MLSDQIFNQEEESNSKILAGAP